MKKQQTAPPMARGNCAAKTHELKTLPEYFDVTVQVTYMTDFEQKPGYVVMSIVRREDLES